MIDAWLLLPAVLVTTAAILAPRATAKMHPAIVVKVLASLALATTISVCTVAVVVVADRSQSGPFHGHHAPGPDWIAVLLALWVASAAFRIGRDHRRRQRVRRAMPGDRGVVSAELDGVIAVAVPGRQARIVVSSSALEPLSPAERAVVIAHEWAHLRHRHTWYATAMSAAATACPWLRSIERHGAFAIERWADEAASTAVRSRQLVAHTIARVGLVAHGRTSLLSIDGCDTAARARAMLGPEPRAMPAVARFGVAIACFAALAVACSGVTLHHALAVG